MMDELNQAIIDKNGYFNHVKLTNMTTANNLHSNTGMMYKIFNSVKREQSLNIEKSNSCMKWGNAFTKGPSNVRPVNEKVM